MTKLKIGIIGIIAAAALAVPVALYHRTAVNARPVTTSQNICLNNLRQIDGAKQEWALEYKKKPRDVPEWTDILPYLGRGASGSVLVCPQGGTYAIGMVSEPPKCSYAGHSLE